MSWLWLFLLEGLQHKPRKLVQGSSPAVLCSDCSKRLRSRPSLCFFSYDKETQGYLTAENLKYNFLSPDHTCLQERGNVGHSSRKVFCFLINEGNTSKNTHCDDEQNISSCQEYYPRMDNQSQGKLFQQDHIKEQ